MRNSLTIALTMTLGAVYALAAPPAYAAYTETCNKDWQCDELRIKCRNRGGSYGQIIYPDGGVWGVCVTS